MSWRNMRSWDGPWRVAMRRIPRPCDSYCAERASGSRHRREERGFVAERRGDDKSRAMRGERRAFCTYLEKGTEGLPSLGLVR